MEDHEVMIQMGGLILQSFHEGPSMELEMKGGKVNEVSGINSGEDGRRWPWKQKSSEGLVYAVSS